MARKSSDIISKNRKPCKMPRPIVRQNGYTRPAPTWGDGRPKITYRVWQLADNLSVKLGRPPTRQEMLTACAGENITYSVFSNQFYRWRKFNGLFSRVKKDGTIAKVTGGPRKFREKAAPLIAKEAAKPLAKPSKPKGLPFTVPPVSV